LTVAELTELRRKLAEKNAHMGVYKNTLVARALKDNGVTVDCVLPSGPERLRLLERRQRWRRHRQQVCPLSTINSWSRWLRRRQVVDAEGMKEVAKIPSKKRCSLCSAWFSMNPSLALPEPSSRSPIRSRLKLPPQLLLRQPINGGKIPWLKS
jgi:ribosomal protein L10